MTEPALELEDVRREVSRAFAVRGVGFAVMAGECLGLVGPSGAGKTTILRLIAGLELPDAGTIRIGGRWVSRARSGVPPHRRGVGLVFQSLALWPHLTVEEHVDFGLDRSLPRSERRSRATAMLERLGLDGYGRRHPSELSGGERQRVALARALVSRPRVLLLDEPLSHLDRPLRRSLLELLVELKREAGAAMVYVSHEREGLAILADRVAVLDCGSLVEQGDTAEVLRHPESDVARRLLGD